MTVGLAWGLGSTTPYIIGETLSTAVRVTAPEGGTYYIIGALYSAELTMYSGTLFGLLQAPSTTIVNNSLSTLSTWNLEEGEELDFTAELSLGSTGCILAIFLYKMVDDIPDLKTDVAAFSVSTSLISPVQQVIEERNTLFNGLLGAVILAAMFPIITKIGRQK